MKTNCYLIVNDKGRIRTTKRVPDLKWDEVAVFVRLEIPKALFSRPNLIAELTLPEPGDQTIEAETVSNVEQVLREDGFEVRVTLAEPELD